MKNELEFSLRMFIFAVGLFYILEYVFVCEISNAIGMGILISVITTVICIFWFFGKKQQKYTCNK